QVGAGADVHVQAGDGHAVAVGPQQALVDLFVPNPVLALFATGVGFLTVSVTEARIDSQGDFRSGATFAELVDHVGRAAVDVQPLLHHQIERLAVEDIGGVDDAGNLAVRLEAGGQGAADFPGTDRIDDDAAAARAVQNRQIAAGLLGVADDVERRQIGDPPSQHRRVVNVQRCTELLGQRSDV